MEQTTYQLVQDFFHPQYVALVPASSAKESEEVVIDHKTQGGCTPWNRRCVLDHRKRCQYHIVSLCFCQYFYI